MNKIEHEIKITRTAQYYTNDNSITSCRYFWFACHGYGMIAEAMVDKFRWAGDDHLIVAPEGLSKFYWEGVTGRPVASWMTKKNRISEIEDNCNYLDKLYNDYLSQLPKGAKKILFGFSQGSATLWRWIHRSMPEFDVCIVWAGSVPEDIEYTDDQISKINRSDLYHFVGDKDIFLTKEREDWVKGIIEQHGMKFEFINFKGEHKVYPIVLEKFFKERIKD
jgi:predicted esterase